LFWCENLSDINGTTQAEVVPQLDDEELIRRKRDRETGEWRRLHEEETEYWYSSTGAIWAVKSQRMR